MSDRMRSLVTGLGTVVFFAIVLFGIIPNHIRVPANVPNLALSPAFWPTTVAIMGILFGGVLLVRALLNMNETDPDEAADPATMETSELRGFVAIIGMFIYLACIHVIGIVAASYLIIPGLGMLYGERRFVKLGLAAVIVPSALFYFFTEAVRVPLPLGVFEGLF